MKKLTSFIKNSNKMDFSKKIMLELDNNVIIEAKIVVNDINESFAKEQIIDMIKDRKIIALSIIKEELDNDILDSTFITEEPTNSSLIEEYYIPWSSIFDDLEINYDIEKMSAAIKDDESVINIHTENSFGWSNQPEVVVIEIGINFEDDIKHTVDRLQNKLQQALGTQWVRLSKKDW